MAKLHTSYLGMTLPNPILAGSSGLTGNLTSLKRLEEHGIGGVVLKSLFEEQILQQIRRETDKGGVIYGYEQIDEYVAYFERKHQIDEYMQLIAEAKQELSIPVIASVNCVSSAEWQQIAGQIAEAGADALQLNMFVPPFQPDLESQEIENEYFEIIKKVKSIVQIPVTAKIGPHFTNILSFSRGLIEAGADGLVLFNRYYSTDFDIEKMSTKAGSYFSETGEFSLPLRWTALLHQNVDGPLTASTGIHDGDTVVKMLLAGADNVEIVSALYKHSLGQIGQMKSRLLTWMEQKGYESLDDFKGLMSQKRSAVPAEFQRVQYMKSYGDLKG